MFRKKNVKEGTKAHIVLVSLTFLQMIKQKGRYACISEMWA
jgi:hypothetical protein